MSPKEIQNYAKVMRKCGIRELAVDGCTITLGETPTPRKRTAKSNVNEPLVSAQPTEEDLLFWSSTSAVAPPSEEAA